MQFTILSVGKINNESLSGVEEYSRRLAVYCRMNFVEIPEEDRQEDRQESINALEMEQLKIKEGRKILTQIKQDQHVMSLSSLAKACRGLQGSYLYKLNICRVQGKMRFSLSLAALLDYPRRFWKGQTSDCHCPRKNIRTS